MARAASGGDDKRRIGVVTCARSDYGLLVPLLRALRDDPGVTLTLIATGMHFSKRHGHTIDNVRAGPFADCLVAVPGAGEDDSPAAAGAAMARGVAGFSEYFARRSLDMVVIMGDRFDALPTALAALPFNLPVAHVSGGDVTVGAIDDSIRHALTKLSHLHFPAHEEAARRIVQMGEEPWRVTTAGEPGLDLLVDFRFDDRPTTLRGFDLDPARAVSVLTYHPETVAAGSSADAIAAVLAAADEVDSQLVITYPNNDPGSRAIIDAVDAYGRRRADCRVHPSLGRERYLNLLGVADCMVGNSSSALVEAPSFELPAVNVGARQRGRPAAANVINAAAEAAAIAAAWTRALDPAFRRRLKGLVNPYGDGRAAPVIAERLKTVALDSRLIRKVFHDATGAGDRGALTG